MPSFTARVPLAIIYWYLTFTCQSCPTFKSRTSCGRKWNNFQLIWPSPEPFLSYFLIPVPLWSTLKRAEGDNRSCDIFSWFGLFDTPVITLVQPSLQRLCVLPVIVAWLLCPLLIYADKISRAFLSSLNTGALHLWNTIFLREKVPLLAVILLIRGICCWWHEIACALVYYNSRVCLYLLIILFFL